MNTRSTLHRFALFVPLASTLWLASPLQAGDSPRMELLEAAGSSQAVQKVHHRHGSRGGRHGHRHDDGYDYDYGRRGHGHDRRHGRHPGRDHGHGHYIRERAHRYAETAVRQAREARALGFRSDHPRWRVGYYRHYHWALQARPFRIEEETRRRARKLRELRTWGYGHAPWDHGRRHGGYRSPY